MVMTLLFLQHTFAAKKQSSSKKVTYSKQKCAGIDKKIDRLNSQMRAGYNLKKGERLKAKLRSLEKKKYGCRMKRFSTK